jgi:hypothetical protein
VTTTAPAAANTVEVFGRRIAYKWVVAIVYVSALFLDILDTTIVNVAIPALGRELLTETPSGWCSVTPSASRCGSRHRAGSAIASARSERFSSP